MHALLLVAGVIVGGVVLWRCLARFFIVPWPYWLAWFLENPYMRVVCHPQALIARARLAAGMHVLDVGCGSGRILLPAAQVCGPAGKAVGVDVQRGMINLCERRFAKHTESWVAPHKLLCGDVRNLVLERETFDRCFLVTVLGETPQRRLVLQRIFTLLKSGGILSVTEVLPDACFQTRTSVKEMAKEVGFRIDEEFTGVLSYTLNLKK